MTKLTLTDVASLEAENTAIATMTANNTLVETAMENTLSRDGTSPNQMGAQLDMNSNRIINLPAPGGQNDPARKQDLDNIMSGVYSGQIINGTSNEITAATVGNVTTLSLPTGLTFTGKTVTGGTFSSCTYSSGTATNLTLVTPTLGTPNSGTLTSCTGLPVSTGISGLGAGVATFLATPSSANLLAAVTDEVGTGKVVFNTSPNIIGSSTNDAAAAGSIGELISSNIASGSAVTLTTTVGANITSISLTAGDWDVSALAVLVGAATTNITVVTASISQTSATVDVTTGGAYGIWRFTSGVVVNGTWTVPAGPLRISLAGTTTIYLVANATFTVAGLTAYGLLQARRRR